MDASEYLVDSDDEGRSSPEWLSQEFSFSKLYLVSACPQKFYLRHVLGLSDDTHYMISGKAIHFGQEIDNRAKLAGKILPLADVLDAAVTKLKEESDGKSIKVDIDAFAKEHGSHLAFYEVQGWRGEVRPVPRTIEAPFEMTLKLKDPKTGAPEPDAIVRGFVDLVSYVRLDGETEEEDRRVIDYKSGSRPYSQTDAQAALQFTLYAIASRAPESQVISFVRGGRQKPTVRRTMPVRVETPQIVRLMTFMEDNIRVIRKALVSGDWPRCNPQSHLCRPATCAFWDRCYPKSREFTTFAIGEIKPVGTLEIPEWRK